MAKTFAVFAATLLALSLPAWADSYETPVPTPPATATTIAPLPALAGPASAHLARIYFYRAEDISQHPEYTAVWLNGAKVGDSAPSSYFYRDVQPGTYTVTADSDLTFGNQFKTITVTPNSTTYVKIYAIEGYGVVRAGGGHRGGGVMSAGIPNVFGDIVVDPRVARQEIPKLQPLS